MRIHTIPLAIGILLGASAFTLPLAACEESLLPVCDGTCKQEEATVEKALQAEGADEHKQGKAKKLAMIAKRIRENQPELFAKIDRNGDGELTRDELAAFKAHRQQHHRDDEAEMKKRYDTDGDGELSEQEKQAAKQARIAQFKERHPKLFAKADQDGDGELSDEEIAAMRKHMQRGEHRRDGKQRGKRQDDRKGKQKSQRKQ